MRCDKCGTALEHAGQGHTCRSTTIVPDRPPGAWAEATGALIGLIALAVIADLANGVLRLTGRSGSLVSVASAIWLVGIVGVLIMGFVWNNRTRRLAEAYSADQETYVWSLGWRLVIVAPMLASILGMWRDSDDHTKILVGMAARAVVGLGVLTAVLISRARVLRLIRDSAAAQQSAGQHAPA
ncbi:hypothetical protein [Actinoplanes awajinensis]|uniref:Uncharacterized protein n=1 Tax=Actinoplanes awajinensis subsp. mycoplanecinus TaxID=135947 RepID=A0A101JTM4_9ACTN|nr:hypothetical protein [Actinoplanes awajinensis]KUL32723.1 hypothetical protein ADL15_19625 [Actinoplanes awajinensis subsp. mycoplanecinus]